MANGKLLRRRKVRGASAFLGLVVILVLAAVVFGIQWWVKNNKPDPDTAEGLKPWKEWRLREESEKPVPEVRAEQAQITTSLKYDANVKLAETGDPRGEVLMWVTPVGQVWGAWSGSYYNTRKMNCDIQGGGFEGRVYPGKIYRDENGEDPSKLYFLAKGKFVIHKSDLKSRYDIDTGDIYANGWLSPDLSVVSDITITSDENYFETFSWKVNQPVKVQGIIAPVIDD